MRTAAGLIAMALGMFCLTFAGLLRFQLAPDLVKLPLGQISVTIHQADRATYFNPRNGTEVRGVPLRATVATTGDVAAGDGDRAVWEEFTELRDLTNDRAVDYTSRRTAFDRRTGLAVSCCAAHVDGDTRAAQEGLGFTWPVRPAPGSYPLYDPALRRAVPAVFTGVEDVEGVLAHRYEQRVPPTPVGTRTLPRRALGQPGRGSVEAEVWYEATRVLWIEPVSGILVDSDQRVREVARDADGIERATILAADLRMSPGSRVDRRHRAAESAGRVRFVDTALPLGLASLGALALAGGGLAVATGRRGADPPPRGARVVSTQADPAGAEPGRAEPGRAEPGRAEPGRAEPGRAERVSGGAGSGRDSR